MKSNFKKRPLRAIHFLQSLILIVSFIFWAQQAAAQTKDGQRQRIDSLFSTWNNDSSAGMELLILQKGKVLLDRSYGLADIGHKTPMNGDTRFWVASMSKQFTALAIAILADQNKLSLNDDIRKWLPEMPWLGDTIRIRNLVYHTSGLREGFTLTAMSYKQEDEYTNANVLKYLSKQTGRNFRPGEKFEYNNGGYVLLAIIVERLTKMPFPDYVQKNIFKPLHMNNSRFVTQFPKDDTHIATGYAVNNENGHERYQPNYFKGATYGSSGLITTANDLARWDRIFYEPVFGKHVQSMQVKTGKLKNGQPLLYACGLEVGLYKNKKAITHNGVDPGYKAEMLRFPEEELTIICLSNAENAYGITAKLFSIAEWLIPFNPKGKSNTPISDEPINNNIPLNHNSAPDSLVLKSFAGSWYSPELDVTYQFFEKEGILYLKFFDAYDLPLAPFADHVFTADFLGTNIIQFVTVDGKPVMEFTREGIYKLRFVRK